MPVQVTSLDDRDVASNRSLTYPVPGWPPVSVKERDGPSFGQRHVTIRGTEEQISAALGVVGKRLARQRVHTPRPARGKGKEASTGKKSQATFSIPFEPPAAAATANRPSPPRSFPPASETPGSYAYEQAHSTVRSATPMSVSQTTNPTPALPCRHSPALPPPPPWISVLQRHRVQAGIPHARRHVTVVPTEVEELRHPEAVAVRAFSRRRVRRATNLRGGVM